MSSGRPMRSAIRCATSQCPDRTGMLTCAPSARPRFDRLLQLFGRRASELSLQRADQEFDKFRPVADIDVMKFAAKGNLVTPMRRQQVGVGVAPDVAQQRLVIDAAACISDRAPRFPQTASPARRSAARSRASDRWPNRSHRPAPSKNQRVELVVPPFAPPRNNSKQWQRA